MCDRYDFVFIPTKELVVSDKALLVVSVHLKHYPTAFLIQKSDVDPTFGDHHPHVHFGVPKTRSYSSPRPHMDPEIRGLRIDVLAVDFVIDEQKVAVEMVHIDHIVERQILLFHE